MRGKLKNMTVHQEVISYQEQQAGTRWISWFVVYVRMRCISDNREPRIFSLEYYWCSGDEKALLLYISAELGSSYQTEPWYIISSRFFCSFKAPTCHCTTSWNLMVIVVMKVVICIFGRDEAIHGNWLCFAYDPPSFFGSPPSSLTG